MAAGPLFSHSPHPTTGSVFVNVHTGTGSGSRYDTGLGVGASITDDAIWSLRFKLPPVIPSGTLKFHAKCLANASAGSGNITVKWASIAAGEDPSSLLYSEVPTQLAWGASDANKYKELEVILNADSAVGGETLVMDLVAEASGWTLAQTLTICEPALIWED